LARFAGDHADLGVGFPAINLAPAAQRFGAFVSVGADESGTQQIEQPICADRDQRDSNRNKCLFGHCLPPQGGDRRRATVVTRDHPPPDGQEFAKTICQPQPKPLRRMAMCKMEHHP